jgi:hypothetical protein
MVVYAANIVTFCVACCWLMLTIAFFDTCNHLKDVDLLHVSLLSF